MEKYISFAIILFILSMICERIADFLKHFIGEQNGWQAKLIIKFFKIGNTSLKGPLNSLEEDKRYYRLLKISIFCGFVTAFILHADFFTILKNINEPTKVFSWDGIDLFRLFDLNYFLENLTDGIKYIVGCLFTGFFISFGSKFWHDLLDLLLEAKNLRRKLVDERTFTSIDNINQFDEFIKMPESKLAQIADERYRTQIEKIQGVISAAPGYMDDNGSRIGCLEIHFENASFLSSVNDSYPIALSTGMIVQIPVHKIVTGVAKAQSAIIGAGMLIQNFSKVNGIGSIGGVVRKKKTAGEAESTDLYLLSCFHVLSGEKDLTKNSINTKVTAQINNIEIEVAKLSEGFRSIDMDAAIALITNSNFEFTNDKILNPRPTRRVNSIDARDKIPIRIFCGISGRERNGFVHNDTWPQPLDYDDVKGFKLEDLFVLTNQSTGRFRPLTEKGDSGSLVIDDTSNEVLGIVVGADLAFTYALKMTTIEKYLNVELI
ncbi:hypothetical protein [Runella aurantiaca]|uniref:Uncharacterized protein n=1 Tax=Runella aurantiaca TaxID=2282308 RepID=A0A369I8I4_9BACT|nr:hypothetical protein [Runella aurantiaca]RDB03833.1 hypothetical protein DVG78_21500 [Runella aurantiaca]